MENPTINKSNHLIIFILTIGVFGILNTEMGVVGIIPLIAETFQVTIPQAGWTVGIFALTVAVSAPIMPLLFSGINRKKVMLLALGVFVLSSLVSAFTSDFTIVLIARVVPAVFHPVYVSMAFTVAASSASREQAPKAVSRIFIGVSAGMVLGVPVTSFIASETSFSAAMIFFAAVNILVLAATAIFVPSIPVKEKLSYGAQLSVLKSVTTWHSIIAVTLINGAMFGFFSYMSDFLLTVTNLPYKIISIFLFIYGGANIVGNLAAGRLLAKNPLRTVKTVPFIMLAVYTLLLLIGELSIPMVFIVLVLGVLAGIASNNCQWMISNAASKATDFANGLYLTSANLGTTIGTALCGLFITTMGTRYSVMGAILFLVLGIVFVFLRGRRTTTVLQDNQTSTDAKNKTTKTIES